MTNDRRIYTGIDGLSDVVRLPRLGKVRLGITQKTPKGERPVNVEHFVVPPEVADITGPNPTELKILFPVDDRQDIFPCALKRYGKGRGLKCSGDGVTAQEALPGGGFGDRKCPCEKFKGEGRTKYTDENGKEQWCDCLQTGTLNCILHEVSIAGIYQIVTHSTNSIIDINSAIQYIRTILFEAHGIESIRGVYLRLVREPTDTFGGGRHSVHYTLKLYPDFDLRGVPRLSDNRNLMIAAPKDVPDHSAIGTSDPAGAIDIEAETVPDPDFQKAQEAAKERTDIEIEDWKKKTAEVDKKNDESTLGRIRNWEPKYKDIDKMNHFNNIIEHYTVNDGSDKMNPDNIHPDDLVACVRDLAKHYKKLTGGE